MSRENDEHSDREFDRLTSRVERAETYDEESRQRDERIERKIEFIVSQQADFNEGMQRLREAQERNEQRWEQRWERAEQRWASTEESVRALLVITETHNGEINALVEAQARTDRQMRETDDRVNALVNAVEALISRRSNGGADAREG